MVSCQWLVIRGLKKVLSEVEGAFYFCDRRKNKKSKIIYGKNFCDHVDPLWNLHIGFGDDYGGLVEWCSES